jgi:PAS domain S-box-containing protein
LTKEFETLQERLRETEEQLQILQKHDEEAHANEELTRLILDQATEVIFVCDQEGRIIRASHIAHRFFASNILKRPFDDVCHLKLSTHSPVESETFSVSSVLSGKIFRALEVTHEGNDGQVCHFLLSARPLLHQSREVLGCLVSLTDVTERKRMEEELRRSCNELENRVQERTEKLKVTNEELQNRVDECGRVEKKLRESESHLRQVSTELLNAQEKERRRIAQDLHDSIGASLAAIKFKLEDVITKVSENRPQTRTTLEIIPPMLLEAIQEARRIQMALRPSILDDLGILATINWFCRQFESTYSHIRIGQEINIKENDVADSLKTAIFRVLQEALNNAAKHSKADRVNFILRKMDGAIELRIQDNGQGFDPAEVKSRIGTNRGLGLDSMRERVELSGGSFAIESAGGKGTTISVSWPVES